MIGYCEDNLSTFGDVGDEFTSRLVDGGSCASSYLDSGDGPTGSFTPGGPLYSGGGFGCGDGGLWGDCGSWGSDGTPINGADPLVRLCERAACSELESP